MPKYRIQAIRRQLVEVIVYSDEWETAIDDAVNTDKHDWDVVETYEIDDFVDQEEIDDYEEF